MLKSFFTPFLSDVDKYKMLRYFDYTEYIFKSEGTAPFKCQYL